MFPAASPKPSARTVRTFSRYDPAHPGLRVVQPYARLLRAYQRSIDVPGPAIEAVVLVGLVGLIVAARRFGGPALLPWLAGLCLLAAPATIMESYPRYLVGAIPPFCVAAAIGIQQLADVAKRFRARRWVRAVDSVRRLVRP
jgi:hypothetical protein